MRSYGCAHVGITAFLALVMIVPGVVYAVWVDAWRKRCPVCDQKALVPADSPRGRELSSKTR
jgi:hypothetical protein